MTLRDKDLEKIIQDSGKAGSNPGAGAGSDSTSGDSGTTRHDPIAAARQEIADHEEVNRSRTLLGKASSFFYSKDEDSLARLKQLTTDYDKALAKGDQQAASKIQQDVSSTMAEDQRYIAMKEDIAHYGSSFLKTAALFTKGEVGLVSTVASYGLDGISSKNSDHWAVDGTLGVGKGLATRGVIELLGNTEMGAINKGMLLGMGNRVADMTFSRQTWEGGLSSGGGKIWSGMTNTESLVTDGVVFGLAHGLGFAGSKVAGGLEKSPVLTSMVTASSFGLLSGSAAEVNRQRDVEHKSFGSFDYGKIAKAGFAEAAIDGLAGAPGGMQERAAASRGNGTADGRGNSLSDRMNVAGKLGPTSLAFTDIAMRLHPLDGSLDHTAAAHPTDRPAESTHGIPKMFQAERNIYNLTSDERAAILEHVHTPMFEEANINDFSRRVLDVTRQWTDVSGSSEHKDKLKADYERTVKVVQDMIYSDVLPMHLAARMHEHETIEQELQDKPQHLADYRAYVAARDAYSQSTASVRDVLDQRALQLQNAVNGFAREYGLPDVRVRHWDDLGSAAATYDIGRGAMTVLDNRLASSANAADLIGSAYHELVHSEQETLVIRNAADELGIGKEITTAQIKLLQERLRETAKMPADEDRIKEQMKLRGGKPLTPDEKARAELMTEGFRINSKVDYKDSANDYRIAAREFAKIGEMNGGYILTDKLMNTGHEKLSMHLFGSETPPPEVQGFKRLLDKFNDGAEDAEWDDKGIRQRYKQMLGDRLKQINDYRRAQYEAYMAGEHEKEAWVVGERARFLAAHLKEIAANDNSVPLEQPHPIPANDVEELDMSDWARAANVRRGFQDVDGGS